MKKQKYLYFSSLIFIALFLFSCNKNEFKVDVSNIDVDLKFVRFDKDFHSIEPENIYTEIPRLEKEYGDFFNLYNLEIIRIGTPDQKEYAEGLSKFNQYCKQNEVFEHVEKIYSDDKILKSQLEEAFKHYKYYFPEKEIPVVYTCLSGFSRSVFTNEGYMGISLDAYLGRGYNVYGQLGLDLYIREKMHKDMVIVDCMRAWSMGEFPPNDSINTLISKMIYEGRNQYFINSMLPEINDTLKWGYTYRQLGWANKHEEKIWDYLVEQKLLFSEKSIDIQTFTGDAAFTGPFQRISAPRAGTFVGYKIVKSFMKHNDLSLQQLMEITDYMQIYNKSQYNP